MVIARRIVLGILGLALGLLLIITALDIGFVRTVSNPSDIKQTIAKSGIYNSVVSSVLAQQKSISTNLGIIPTDNPIIQRAANVALPPQFIQQNTEAIIDNIYQWLDGSIAAPNFNVTLSGARVLFANNVADSIQSRLSALPPCQTFEQSLNFNILHATCLPPGLSPSSAAEQAKSSVMKEEGFLDKAVLSSNDIKLNSLQSGETSKPSTSEQPLFDQPAVKRIPRIYRLAKQSPWVLVVISILSAIGVFFLSATKRSGLRLVGIILLATGVIMLILSWGFNQATGQLAVPRIKASTLLLQTDIRQIVVALEQQIDKNYWFAGGIYSILGGAAIWISIIYRRQAPEEVGNKGAPVKKGRQKPRKNGS